MHRRTIVLLAAIVAAPPSGLAATVESAPAGIAPRAQTVPSEHDAAGSVAIWLHPHSPEASLLLGAGGTAGLEVYALDGSRLQRYAEIEADHVTVRQDIELGKERADVVVVGEVRTSRLHFLAVDPQSRQVRPVPADSIAVDTEITGLCTYRSPLSGKVYLQATTDDGDLHQWRLNGASGRLVANPIRRVPVGRGAGACAADDAGQSLYVAVETLGLLRIAAEPESDSAPTQLEAITPLGAIDDELKGLALYPADDATYLLVHDAGAGTVRVYDSGGKRLGAFRPAVSGPIAAVKEPEAFALLAGGVPGFEGGLLAVIDEANEDSFANYKLYAWSDVATALGLGLRTDPPVASGPAPRAVLVRPAGETEPVQSWGDAADDPAVWAHPTDPARSLIIGTDKKRGLEVYDVEGRRLQTLPDGRMNNVDVRDGFRFRGQRVPLVAASNRTTKTIALYRIDVESGRLMPVELEVSGTGLRDPYGLCLYRSARNDRMYVFINDADDGLMRQWRLEDRGGRVRATRVRDIEIGSQAEGCVADDALGHLYVGEEDVGLWKYGAEPSAGAARTAVDRTEGGNLSADVEGMGLWLRKDGTGFLVVSNQGADNYAVYRREGDNDFLGTFHVVASEELGIDGVSETDGLEVTSAPLGPGYPQGLLVVQDGRNLSPSARQNFKLVPWHDVVSALGLPD